MIIDLESYMITKIMTGKPGEFIEYNPNSKIFTVKSIFDLGDWSYVWVTMTLPVENRSVRKWKSINTWSHNIHDTYAFLVDDNKCGACGEKIPKVYLIHGNLHSLKK